MMLRAPQPPLWEASPARGPVRALPGGPQSRFPRPHPCVRLSDLRTRSAGKARGRPPPAAGGTAGRPTLPGPAARPPPARPAPSRGRGGPRRLPGRLYRCGGGGGGVVGCCGLSSGFAVGVAEQSLTWHVHKRFVIGSCYHKEDTGVAGEPRQEVIPTGWPWTSDGDAASVITRKEENILTPSRKLGTFHSAVINKQV